jgi:hypothetical protein
VSITNRGRERLWLCIYRHINVCTRAIYYQNNQRGQRGLGQWILDKTKVFHSSTKVQMPQFPRDSRDVLKDFVLIFQIFSIRLILLLVLENHSY